MKIGAEVGSEVLKTSAVKFTIFLAVTPCILLFTYQPFDGPDDGSSGIAGVGDSYWCGRPRQHSERGEE
jgi:hypothetical protein